MRFLPAQAVGVILCACAMTAQGPQAAAPKVDFGQDVRPLLQQNCVKCHGAKVQNGGLRLDQKSSVMKPASRRVVPGNSANSAVYQRVADSQFGMQMPPNGELPPENIAKIKQWIDEGAEWPDALSNEAGLPPLDPAAIAAVEMLHEGNVAAFVKAMKAKPALLNARGPEGSTPFMYAVLYTDAPTLKTLLQMGADPNRENDEGATALLWGARDLAMTELLVAHGANVNAASTSFRTPLMIAARKPGGTAVVRFLLEHGANPNPNAHPEVASSPLLEAATGGNAESFALLMQHGAKVGEDAPAILTAAVTTQCRSCFDLTAAKADEKFVYTIALLQTAVLGDARTMKLLLDRGADVSAYDPFGHTALMYAAESDVIPLDSVKLLVAHGADVNARSKHANSGDSGMTVLDMAKQHGATPVVEFLVASGAKPSGIEPAALHLRSKNDLRSAIQDSLPLLQRADVQFAKNSGCVSCHNNSLTGMTVGLAHQRGLTVDKTIEARQVKVNVDNLAMSRDYIHQGFLVPVGDNFSENVMGYVLLGLNAEGYKADVNTDAASMLILSRQSPDGHWDYPHADTRQPLCLTFVGNTALGLRSLQLYPVKSQAAVYRKAVQAAASWLATVQGFNNEDRNWRVAGLAWAGDKQAGVGEGGGRACGEPEGGWRVVGSPDDEEHGVCDGEEPGVAAPGGNGGVGPGVQTRDGVAADAPGCGWVVVCADARAGLPAVGGCRVPAWLRPVHLDGGDELGGHGAHAGAARRRGRDGVAGALRSRRRGCDFEDEAGAARVDCSAWTFMRRTSPYIRGRTSRFILRS